VPVLTLELRREARLGPRAEAWGGAILAPGLGSGEGPCLGLRWLAPVAARHSVRGAASVCPRAAEWRWPGAGKPFKLFKPFKPLVRKPLCRKESL